MPELQTKNLNYLHSEISMRNKDTRAIAFPNNIIITKMKPNGYIKRTGLETIST